MDARIAYETYDRRPENPKTPFYYLLSGENLYHLAKASGMKDDVLNRIRDREKVSDCLPHDFQRASLTILMIVDDFFLFFFFFFFTKTAITMDIAMKRDLQSKESEMNRSAKHSLSQDSLRSCLNSFLSFFFLPEFSFYGIFLAFDIEYWHFLLDIVNRVEHSFLFLPQPFAYLNCFFFFSSSFFLFLVFFFVGGVAAAFFLVSLEFDFDGISSERSFHDSFPVIGSSYQSSSLADGVDEFHDNFLSEYETLSSQVETTVSKYDFPETAVELVDLARRRLSTCKDMDFENKRVCEHFKY